MDLSEEPESRRGLSGRRAGSVAIAVTLAVWFAAGCSRLPWPRKPAEPPGVAETEVHALSISPDVDYANALDLGEGRKLYHSNRDLLYADGDRFYPIVVQGYPRVVGKSPGGDAVAILEPAEFEMAADLYVFDVPALTLRRLTDHRDQDTTLSVKAARWYDERTIYYLEGYRFGTVSRGGDLWRADLETLERKPVVQIKSGEAGFEEIVAFEFVPGNKLIRYVLARYDEYGEPNFRPRYCTLDGKPVK